MVGSKPPCGPRPPWGGKFYFCINLEIVIIMNAIFISFSFYFTCGTFHKKMDGTLFSIAYFLSGNGNSLKHILGPTSGLEVFENTSFYLPLQTPENYPIIQDFESESTEQRLNLPKSFAKELPN